MTMTRSATAVSARITCSMQTTASPRARTAPISSMVWSISAGLSPPNGSSSRMADARVASAVPSIRLLRS